MKIFLFYIVFFIILYEIFPRIGALGYIDESKNLNPADGFDKHYRYDSKLCRFHWGIIFTGYFIVLMSFAGIPLGIFQAPKDGNFLFWFMFGIGIISLPCVPYAIVLLSLKNNPKAGVYIYEDRIVCIGRFFNQTIYKKDIESIEFRGILWGVVIKKKGSSKYSYIMAMTENLSQQISTLENFVKRGES